ncbi:small subunit ribosomal protein S4 [Mycoplasma testudineum]|uniref:Small ribosomal subunit protein uS4 n=1 Tax=Mycoplasma testudineum TaxID=244584 RepID=A0A4R6IG59_9MOLU|nr:30S ribosomal protein S4 [Mycoplasma testudineum]OYD26789.1 30S ribosomal protein S4 [Mycoplasma testudineum]TDO19925.1 small subunit ribosomal protein S4 [Mycoplasma testudineum]
MSRIRGSVFKRSRRYGFSILETGKEFSKGKKRQYAPGQHGQRRSKLSDYGKHLYEKQKVRYLYGINEKQFKASFFKASKRKGVVGTNFLQYLEQRLDNLVYRAGWAETRRQARQFVNHGHVLVNGKKATIPSMIIPVGAALELKEKFAAGEQVKRSIEVKTPAAWMKVSGIKATFERMPERKEFLKDINESLIVEFYSK